MYYIIKRLYFWLAFRDRVPYQFQKGVLATLSCLENYFNLLIEQWLKNNQLTNGQQVTSNISQDCDSGLLFSQSRDSLVASLVNMPGVYPEWAYHLYLDSALYRGFRFFLLHVEQLIEIVFSMNSLMQKSMRHERLLLLMSSLEKEINMNYQLLTWLIVYFRYYMAHGVSSDDLLTQAALFSNYSKTLTKLESMLMADMPCSLEMIDFYPDHLRCMTFVYYIKEMRFVLLQLINAVVSGK